MNTPKPCNNALDVGNLKHLVNALIDKLYSDMIVVRHTKLLIAPKSEQYRA